MNISFYIRIAGRYKKIPHTLSCVKTPFKPNLTKWMSAPPVLPSRHSTGLTSPDGYRTSGLKVLAQNHLLHHEHGREFYLFRHVYDTLDSSIQKANTKTRFSSNFLFYTDLAVNEFAQTRSLLFQILLYSFSFFSLLVKLVSDIQSCQNSNTRLRHDST